MQTTGRLEKEARLIRAVSLRPFPYPYRAGLAIASDIDRCDRAAFVRVHQFLNCPRNGLGLPVADSFFGVGRACGHMAYFLDDGRTPSQDAEMIRLGLASGLIDTLHSWGAFDRQAPRPQPLRQAAEHLTRDLARHGLSVAVWSNHGAPTNLHNFYTRTEPRFAGDDPASPYYTADLLDALGLRFYWGSELAPWPLSGRAPGGLMKLRAGARRAQNALKNLVKRAARRPGAVRPGRAVVDLACPLELRDGRALLGFNRFNRHPRGLWGVPTRHTLRHGLHPAVLDRLVAEQGYLIVYTHLGMPYPAGAELFPEADARALRDLATRLRAGAIWVAPTAVLLRFWLAAHHLRWRAAIENEKIVIRIDTIDDPATGPRAARPGDLDGICFYTPRPADTCVCLDGRTLETTAWPADAAGRRAVGFPPAQAPEIDFLGHFRNT